MTKLLKSGVLACTIAFASHPAIQAGEHQLKRVSIGGDDTYQWASGNVGDVYNSADDVETIWCEVRGYNYIHGICFARDAKGTTLQCNTMVEATTHVMHAINGDSTVLFRVNRQGVCAAVFVTNGSYAAPKLQRVAESDPTALDTTGLENLSEVKQ